MMMQFPRSTLLFRSKPVHPRLGRISAVTLFAIMIGLCPALRMTAQPSTATGTLNPERIALTGPTRLQAKDISIQVTDDVQIRVKVVDALVLPTRSPHPVWLDDPTSMRIQIQNAETSVSAEALTNLMNEYVLPHAKTSVRDLTVSFEDGQVHVAGKLHKMIDVPFSAEGPLSVTPDGSVRMHFTKITAAGLVHKKVLDWLGLDASAVASAGKSHSFQVIGDDFIFPLHVLFPPPHFTGLLRSAMIEGQDLKLVLGTPRPFAPAPVPAEHYLYFRGGVLQFGRLTMQGVDLELLNKEEGQPLNFSVEHLFVEALPGYFKNLPNHGIVAYIASYRPSAATAKESRVSPDF